MEKILDGGKNRLVFPTVVLGNGCLLRIPTNDGHWFADSISPVSIEGLTPANSAQVLRGIVHIEEMLTLWHGEGNLKGLRIAQQVLSEYAEEL